MIERKYQTFWPRFWGGCIDSLVFIPLMILDHLVWKNHNHLPILIIVFWYTTYSLSYLLYSVLMHGKYGQTLGKMATRVKVLDISESRLTMSQAIRRDIVLIALTAIGVILEIPKIASGINIYDQKAFDASLYIILNAEIAWFLAELVTMLFNNKRRAVHDYIAGSVVIRLSQQNAPLDRQDAPGSQ